MSRLVLGIAAVAVLAGLGAGAWFWSQRSAPLKLQIVVPAVPVAQPAPIAPPPPAIQHPVEAAVPEKLAALAEAEAFVTDALTELLGRKAVLSMLQTDGFVRRIVATVDNLARAHAVPRLWPVNPTPGRFTVTADNRIKPGNEERYSPFVLLVESIDTARVVALYVRLYPLFQRADVELGYPDGYFNDRQVAVIDHLLATPLRMEPLPVVLTEVRGEIKSERPWVRYQFADPALDTLSSGQKLLLRIGPINQRRLKARLAELRKQVTGGALKAKP